jgi:hypothetical protein
MRTLKHRCEPSAARDGLLRFAQPMATLRSPSPQRPSGSTSWIFWEHSDEMTGNILARQRHPRLGTSTDEAIRIPILIVALQRTKANMLSLQSGRLKRPIWRNVPASSAENSRLKRWLAQ